MSERKIELLELMSLLKPITALNSKSQAEQPVQVENLLTLYRLCMVTLNRSHHLHYYRAAPGQEQVFSASDVGKHRRGYEGVEREGTASASERAIEKGCRSNTCHLHNGTDRLATLHPSRVEACRAHAADREATGSPFHVTASAPPCASEAEGAAGRRGSSPLCLSPLLDLSLGVDSISAFANDSSSTFFSVFTTKACSNGASTTFCSAFTEADGTGATPASGAMVVDPGAAEVVPADAAGAEAPTVPVAPACSLTARTAASPCAHSPVVAGLAARGSAGGIWVGGGVKGSSALIELVLDLDLYLRFQMTEIGTHRFCVYRVDLFPHRSKRVSVLSRAVRALSHEMLGLAVHLCDLLRNPPLQPRLDASYKRLGELHRGRVCSAYSGVSSVLKRFFDVGFEKVAEVCLELRLCVVEHRTDLTLDRNIDGSLHVLFELVLQNSQRSRRCDRECALGARLVELR
ncbi:hypothetical protein PybrP1_003770 [[Pythium] brassicae (nom. inval.)]|nr:hypothetical protein PybrP1_003770 [[Pythium] brassicae (nom. inval.)]